MDMNPLDKIKSAGSERLAKSITPSEIPHVRHGLNIAVGIEHEQAAALNDALDAADVDDRLHHDREGRRNFLLEAADAIGNQRFREWWFERVAGERLHHPEHAAQYAGLDSDEWHDQVREWYADAYDRGLVDTPPAEADPAEIGDAAAKVVRSQFGVSLREFVEIVVTWDRGEATRQVFAGPADAHTQVIRRLTEEIEQRNERIAELENSRDT